MYKNLLQSGINRNNFIEENKPFIYKITSNICRHYLSWQNDDELSIALIAFNRACDTYSENKGSFYGYAEVIIKNALIDYFRKNSNKYCLTFNDEDNNIDYIDQKISVDQYQIQLENEKREEEVIQLSTELSSYGLNFGDLVESSPSHNDTRNALLNIALQCSKNNSILSQIREKKVLPISQISILTGANKKYLGNWRRYLLVLILILSNENYYYIKDYLDVRVGEKNG